MMPESVRRQPLTTVINLDFSSDSEDDLVKTLKSATKMSVSSRLGSTQQLPERGDTSPLSSAPSDLDIDLNLDLDATFTSFERSKANAATEASSLESHRFNDSSKQDRASNKVAVDRYIDNTTEESSDQAGEMSTKDTGTARKLEKPRVLEMKELIKSISSTHASKRTPFQTSLLHPANPTTSMGDFGAPSSNDVSVDNDTSISMKMEITSQGDHGTVVEKARADSPLSSWLENSFPCDHTIPPATNESGSPVSIDQHSTLNTMPAVADEGTTETTQQPSQATSDSQGFAGHSQGRRAESRSESLNSSSERDLTHKTITPPSSIEDQPEVNKLVDTEDAIEMAKGVNLGTQILEAVGSSNRKAMKSGDVAIILDVDDLSKTVLLPSDKLFSASKLLKRNAALQTTSKGSTQTQDGIKYVFLLEANKEVVSLPKVTLIITRSYDDLKNDPEYRAYSCALQAAKNEAAKTPIKKEGEDVQDVAEAQATISRDWLQAFQALLSMLAGERNRYLQRLFHTDARSALPQVEATIEVAKYLEALPEVRNALNGLFYAFVGNSTLWEAVSVDAASWMVIGLDAEDSTVYHEAFKHIAGRYPEWPWQTPEANIPESVMTAIKKKSENLLHFRDSVNVELLAQWIVLNPNNQAQRGPASTPCFLAPRRDMVKWLVASVWHQWIIEHINYLKEIPAGAVTVDPKRSAICPHENGACLTDAGLYSTIGKGGDAYLKVDQVLSVCKDFDMDKDTVRDTLVELKNKAATIVGPLASSTLQYGGKDKIGYLTCVEVEPDDLPWD